MMSCDMKEEQSLAQLQLLLKHDLSVVCKPAVPLKFRSIHATNLKGILGCGIFNQ